MGSKSLRVLLFDSDLDWSRALRRRLRERGAEVTATAILRGLLGRVRDKDPDVIVLGESFPDLGLETVAGLLRGKDGNRRIILLLREELGDVEELRRDLDLFYVGRKPVSEETMMEVFKPLFTEKGAGAPMPRRPVVMCVDDDPLHLDELTRLLHRQGYRVAAFTDSERALEAFPLVRPDLAILDLLSSGRGGFQMVEEIRETYGPRVPVVLLSGLTSDREVTDAYRSGASCYLSRPCLPGTLLRTVDALIGSATEGSGSTPAMARAVISRSPCGPVSP